MRCHVQWVVLCALCLCLLPGAVRAEGGPPGLTGGFLESSTASITGDVPNQSAGMAVAVAGDVNGDGFADVLVGLPGSEDAVDYVGGAWLFLGGRDDWHFDMGFGRADVIFEGESGLAWTGYSVAGSGDINCDGYNDLVIGSPRSDDDVGKVYAIWGRPEWPRMMGLGGADAIFTGDPGSLAGWSLDAAGDVNADGCDDLIIGAPNGITGVGKAYLVLGNHQLAGKPLSSADAIYTARQAGDLAGFSVAGAGDVNGDGRADLLIGAPYRNVQTGEAYLILGKKGPYPSTVSLANASRIYYGLTTGTFLGWAVSGAGDVNGDGFADILVSFGDNALGNQGGGAYLVLGRTTPRASCMLDTCCDEGYRGAPGSNAGGRLSDVGDVNGDGYADFLIGACGYEEGDSTGQASLVLGHPNPDGVLDLVPDADATYKGMQPGEQGCITQAGRGDINGDGLSDLVIGSPGWGAQGVGKAYVIFADEASPTAARYRVISLSGQGQVKVGESGVTAYSYEGSTGAPGSVYVTRHFVDTCATRFATNGLLWTVERNHSKDQHFWFTFHYNDWQISGWEELQLKLWYRERPCEEWVQDTGASLSTLTNRITSKIESWHYREYTIAPMPLYLYLPLIVRD